MDFMSQNLPEIWGGIECTINRVRDKFRDQLSLSGHYERCTDIKAFAELGIKKLRYPLLWEKHEAVQGVEIDWTWTSQQLNEIRSYGITPIAGLLHHGSGPSFTNLFDSKFPEKFAVYAGKVAMQFPWIQYYTPVNEPLTTARFSGLYGHWYPHHNNEVDFFTILLNQLKGTVLAMQAIRKINPDAELIQTEDLAKIHSSPTIRYQAEFENKRRWLTNDLLSGLVNKKHFFWKYFRKIGIPESKLQFFLDNPFKPSVLGWNYYVTSERFLDTNIEDYPGCAIGSNKRHKYADVAAVERGQDAGLALLLEEAWDRYHIPLAVTECHLNCTREEQMRWFKEVYDQCCCVAKKGIPLLAVTAWALVGAYDWNSLLTKEANVYESGVFEINNNQLRATSLTKLIRDLATSKECDHPVLAGTGWWHKHMLQDKNGMTVMSNPTARPLLIIGKTGTLGYAFQQACLLRSLKYVAVDRSELNILDESMIRDVINKYRPWGVINTAGYVRVDDAEADVDACYAANVTGAVSLARVCKDRGIGFMSFSSDLVFNGNQNVPYLEEDTVSPLNVYGHTKAEAERLILEENSASLIIRTSAFFGPWDKYNFALKIVEAAKRKETIIVPKDVIISPTYLPDLCHRALDLFIDEERGLWHIANEGSLSWSDFGTLIMDHCREYQHPRVIQPTPAAEMQWQARRPLYSALKNDKGINLPSLENAVGRFFKELQS